MLDDWTIRFVIPGWLILVLWVSALLLGIYLSGRYFLESRPDPDDARLWRTTEWMGIASTFLLVTLLNLWALQSGSEMGHRTLMLVHYGIMIGLYGIGAWMRRQERIRQQAADRQHRIDHPEMYVHP